MQVEAQDLVQVLRNMAGELAVTQAAFLAAQRRIAALEAEAAARNATPPDPPAAAPPE